VNRISHLTVLDRRRASSPVGRCFSIWTGLAPLWLLPLSFDGGCRGRRTATRPRRLPHQCPGEMAADLTDIPPRKLAGHRAGRRPGEHRHQQDQQARSVDQAQQCPGDCPDHPSDGHRDGHLADTHAEEVPNPLRDVDPGGPSSEHPENYYGRGVSARDDCDGDEGTSGRSSGLSSMKPSLPARSVTDL